MVIYGLIRETFRDFPRFILLYELRIESIKSEASSNRRRLTLKEKAEILLYKLGGS
jgi:hypothetical protein